MGEGRVRLEIDDRVARVTFDRPEARNALTFAMYAELLEACETIDATPGLAAAVLRGAGEAFVAGTDISEFTAFTGGEDGLAYERRVEAVVGRLEALAVPTLAVVDGPAMGGGLVLAAACDLRIVTPRSRLGVPIAQTLGNTLSAGNVARLVRAFGTGRTQAMLLMSAVIDGAEAKAAGFAIDCVAPEALDARVEAALGKLRTAAPLTLASIRETLRRLAGGGSGDNGDLIARVYGSADFSEGVDAFLGKRRPAWQGR
jgi:enoyl-CoA hydratase